MRFQHASDELIAWSDTATAQDKVYTLEVHLFTFYDKFPISAILDLAGRAPDLYFLANRHTVENVGHGTTRLAIIREVSLHHQFKCAIFLASQYRPRGRVRADEHTVFEVEAQLDVLASSQSQRLFVLWESEAIASRVLGDFFAPLEIGRDPAMFLERKVLLSVLGRFGQAPWL